MKGKAMVGDSSRLEDTSMLNAYVCVCICTYVCVCVLMYVCIEEERGKKGGVTSYLQTWTTEHNM